jgi:hypothetical protein
MTITKAHGEVRQNDHRLSLGLATAFHPTTIGRRDHQNIFHVP